MKQHHTNTTRILFTQNGELLQDNSYYPFGMQMSGLDYSTGTSPENKYLYNGKELQDDFELDWYDYGARMYDAQIGRWHVVDPLAEERSWVSPYHYVQNNPLLRIDSTGTIDTKYIDEKGNTIVETDDNCNAEFVVLDNVENEFISKVMELDKTGEIHDRNVNKDLTKDYGIPLNNLKEKDNTYSSGDISDKNAYQAGYKYAYQGKALVSFVLQVVQGIQPDKDHHNDAAYYKLGSLQGKADAREGKMNMFNPNPKNNEAKVSLNTINFNPYHKRCVVKLNIPL